MKRTHHILTFLLVLIIAGACRTENKIKDRSEASEMFFRIIELTEKYTSILSEVTDSASWSDACREFEDSLDKVNFSYPPDTDLLLTEGQNDTIQRLMAEYIRVRDERHQDIMHPILSADTLLTDSLGNVNITDAAAEIISEDASHSHSN